MESILWQEILANCISSISKQNNFFSNRIFFLQCFVNIYKVLRKFWKKKSSYPSPPSLQKPMSFCDLGSLGQVNVYHKLGISFYSETIQC